MNIEYPSHKRGISKVLLVFIFGLSIATVSKADHVWFVNSLDIIEDPAGSGSYKIDYTFTVSGATVKRFYWELFVVEKGCNASEGFNASFTGCTLLGNLATGDYSGTLAENILLCSGKTYDAVLYTRRRGDCKDDNTGGSGGNNPASCNGPTNSPAGTCSDASCGCPEDRADVADPRGLLIQFPTGGPQIWGGTPLNTLGDTPSFDGNWAYISTTLQGVGVPDYDFSLDIETDDCYGSFDQMVAFDETDGQIVFENFGGSTAQVRCGSSITVTYDASNNCGPGYPGNSFEVIDNSTIGGNSLGSANVMGPMGPNVNFNGRFEELSGAISSDNVCEPGKISLNLINASCSSEATTNVTVEYDFEVVYPTSKFATPTRINCSDVCGQELVLAGAQWNNMGINLGNATTLPVTDDGGLFSFDWSGPVCTPAVSAVDCETGAGSVTVDNCLSCGTYEITYDITHATCNTCNTSTTEEVQVVSPVIGNQSGDLSMCSTVMPAITFEVFECNPSNGAATATAYTGSGEKMWTRSDGASDAYLPYANPGTVAPNQTVLFTPHWRFDGCEACNAVGDPIMVTSIGVLEVTCPSANDLGDFDCSNLATIPAAPTSEATAEEAPYNIVIGDTPCGAIVVISSDDMVPDACTDAVQVITRTVTIIDDQDGSGTLTGSEFQETCTFTFEIIPNFDPPAIISPRSDIEISCENPPTPTTLNYSNGGTNDCLSQGSVTSTLSAYPGICGGVMIETWTIPASSNCDRAAVVSSREITILPPSDPVITCGPNGVVSCEANIPIGTPTVETSCGATSTVTHVGPTLISGTANCGGAVYSIVFTATDECGNSASCTQTFTLFNPGPTITCAADETVACAADITETMPAFTTSCGVAGTVTTVGPTLISGSADCPGAQYTIVYTVTDACNRATSCTQTFTIANAIPTITCPADAIVECAADITIGTPSFTTSCTLGSSISTTGPTLISGDADCPGAKYHVVYTVTDVCGREANCTQVFTIVNDAPTIIAPANETVTCAADIAAGTATGTSSCTLGITITNGAATLVSGADDCPGAVYNIIYTIIDDCGRQATATQTFTIDNPGPMISCPADMIVACANDIIAGTPSTSSSCSLGVSISNVGPNRVVASGIENCPGTAYTIVYTVTDDCGREADCTQTFTIANDPPTIVCPANLTVTCKAEVVAGTAVVTTSCGLGSSVSSAAPVLVSGDDGCDGAVYQIVYTGEDVCGRQVSCTQTFTISNTPPKITCAPDRLVECLSSIVAEAPTVASSCGLGLDPVEMVGPTLVSGQDNCNGAVYEIVYSVTDECGRTSSCTQTFTLSNVGPAITACPADMTIICEADIVPSIDAVTYITSCGLRASVTAGAIVPNAANSACGELKGDSYSITYTVEDDCGRQATCVQRFTVDSSDPDVTCAPDIIVIGCDASDAPAPDPSIISGSASCGDVTAAFVSDVLMGGGCPGDTLVISRTYSVTNACGVASTCVQLIKIVDNVIPVITVDMPSISTSCDEDPGLPTITVSDNCSATADIAVVLRVDTVSMVCPGNLMIVRTWTATDECGNVDSVKQEIGVFDNTNPTFLSAPADTIISCIDVIPDSANPVFDDNCAGLGMPTFTEVVTAGTCVGEQSIKRTWSVLDACSNEVSFTQTITVTDEVPPTINCPADVVVIGCDVSDAPPADITTVTASDICSDVTITHEGDVSIGAGCLSDTLVITRTYRATDECGNFTECIQLIKIVDNVVPVITSCPADVIVIGCSAADAPAIDPSLLVATDICSTPMFSHVSDTPSGTVCIGDTLTIIRIYRATDICGNFTDCTQIIKIVDSIDPVITSCPPPVAVKCFAEIPGPVPGDVVSTDNCGVTNPATTISTTNNGGSGCAGDPYVLIYTYEVTDACGNATTCTQSITVIDDVAPVIIGFPPDQTIECIGDLPAPAPGAIVSTDNCGIESVAVIATNNTSDNCTINPYFVTYTYEVQDSCGNSDTHIQTITIEDVTPPVLSALPANITVECYSQVPGSQGVTATDNCLDVKAVQFVQSPAGACVGRDVITNTWTVEDCVGNVTTHTQIVRVDDVTPPVLLGTPADLTVTCFSDVPGDPGVTATDNCGEVLTVSYTQSAAGACLGDDVITNTWTAEDCRGNKTTYVQTVTIVDGVAPVLSSTPADVEVECFSQVPGDPGVTATDNCGEILTVTYTQSLPGACPGDDTLTNTWTVTDCAGNVTTYIQTVTINDVTPPILSALPGDIIIACQGDLPADPGITATDNCGETLPVTLVRSALPACSGSGTVTNTWTVTDCAGNQTQHVQIITIDDNTAPVFNSTPADVTITCLSDLPGDPGITASDNCGDQIDATFVQSTLPACPGDGTVTNTWTVIDCAGNQSVYVQTVTIDDNTAPVFSAEPADIVVTCISDVPGDPGVTATDNCGEPLTVTYTQSAPGTCPGMDMISNTWTVTDCAGNVSTYIQTVLVRDVIAPVLSSLPADMTVTCFADVPGDPGVTATDNCGEVVTVVYAQSAPGSCAGDDTITNTWTVTDCANNVTTHVQTITIDDNVAPVLSALPANITVTCFADVPGDPGITATDNCGQAVVVTYVQSMPAACDGGGAINNTWSTIDCAGNPTSYTQIVTIEDGVDPIAPADEGSTVSCLTNAILPDTPPDIVDNCGSTISPTGPVVSADPPCIGTGIRTYTWTYTDCSGNSDIYTYTYTILDIVAPAFDIRPIDISLNCEDPIPAVPTVLAIDACQGVLTPVFTEVIAGDTDECPNDYTITRSWSIVDCAGNSNSHTQVITITDTEAPAITCPADLLIIGCNVSYTPPADITSVIATDNCDIPVITHEGNVITGDGCIGDTLVIARTYRATDQCGNFTECVQLIKIVDDVAPIVSGIQDITVDCNDDVNGLFAAWVNGHGGGMGTDNCNTFTWTTDPPTPVIVDPTGATCVTFIATDRCGNFVSQEACFNINCASIIKTYVTNLDQDNSTDVSIGDILEYSIAFSNDGSTVLNNVVVTDNLITPSSITCPTLAPGSTCTLNGSYEVQPIDVQNGMINNIGTGSSDETTPIEDNISIPVATPQVLINKSNPTLFDDRDGSTDMSVGDVIEYRIVATNTGTANLTNVTVTDPHITPNSRVCNLLAPLDTCVLVGTYTITSDDLSPDSILNVATVTTDQTPPAEDDVTIHLNNPEMSIVKSFPTSADNDNSGDLSFEDVLTYTIVVTNTGTAYLTNVVITDTNVTQVGGTSPCALLAPGETCTLIGEYVIPDLFRDAVPITNVASVTSDQVGPEIDSTTIRVPRPSFELNKSAATLTGDFDGSQDISLNDEIEYTITIYNNGNANLQGVQINDPLITPSVQNCGTLLVGESCDLVGVHVVNAQDIANGSFANFATSTAVTQELEDSDSSFVVVPQPSHNMSKSAPVLIGDNDNSQDVSVGDELEYTITVNNTGTANLTNVTITDPLISPSSKVCSLLPPGEACVLVGTYIVQSGDLGSNLENTATSVSDQTELQMDDSEQFVPLPLMDIKKSEALMLVDTDNNNLFSTGDTVQFTITVTNVGTANLTDVLVEDDHITPQSKVCDFIAPSETCVLVGYYVIKQSDMDNGMFDNSTVGTSVQAPPVVDNVLTILPFIPGLSIDKSVAEMGTSIGVNDDLIDPGDIITYSYVVTNTGLVTMDNIIVNDLGPSFGGVKGTNILSNVVCDVDVLLPNEQATCTATYEISKEDFDNAIGLDDGVVNAANAEGLDPRDGTFISADDIAVDSIPDNALLEITKSASEIFDLNDDGILWVGDEISYTFVVTNIGNSKIDNIFITDDKLIEPIVCNGSELSPGQSLECTSTYIVEELDGEILEVLNIAIADGISQGLEGVSDLSDDPNDPTTSSSDPTVVPIPCPSLACPGNINITLAPGEDLFVTPEMLGLAKGLSLELFTEEKQKIAENQLDCSFANTIVTYKIFHPCRSEACWGTLRIEAKGTPEATGTYSAITCGDELPELMTFDEIIDAVYDRGCYGRLEQLVAQEEILGDGCDTARTIRTVTAQLIADDAKFPVVLHKDTIDVLPLDHDDVECPLGPDLENAVKIECDIAAKYPSLAPEYLYEMTGRDVRKSYPYIDPSRQIITIDTITYLDTIIESTIDDTTLIAGQWVLIDVIVKDTIYKDSLKVTTEDIYIPLKPGKTCNLSVTYEDIFYESCLGADTKLLRKWTVLDWCEGGLKTCDQWIVITDETAPVIELLHDDYVSIEPWTCSAVYNLPSVEIEDNCSEFTRQWLSDVGVIDGDVIKDLWLDDSPANVYLEVKDACGNVARDTFQLYIVDSIAPVALAVNSLNVSISKDPVTEEGVAKVYATDLDGGSHDADCNSVTSCVLTDDELRNPIIRAGVHLSNSNGDLMYQPVQCAIDGVYEYLPEGKDAIVEEIPYVICKDFVKFCCADIGSHRIALVVSDGSGYSADGISWSIVTVEDKSSAVVQCEDITIECSQSYHPDVIGYPTVYDAICSVGTLTYEDDGAPGLCGEGVIKRTWSLNGVVECIQRIYITAESSFDPYTIKWPKHYDSEVIEGVRRECELWLDADGESVLDSDGNEQYRIVEYVEDVKMGELFNCTSGDDLGSPTWCEVGCTLIGASFEPTEVEASQACKKVIRRWTLIDWCTWDENSANPDDDVDSGIDLFEAVDDEWLDAYDVSQAGKWLSSSQEKYNTPVYNYPDNGLVTKLDCESCEKANEAADKVYFRYTSVDKDGYYTFDQIIKVLDETAPIIIVEATTTVEILNGAGSKGEGYDNCYGDATVMASATDACASNILDESNLAWMAFVLDEQGGVLSGPLSGFGDTMSVSAGPGRQGEIRLIVWTVTDGCGNSITERSQVVYNDVKQPTPICIESLSTATMNSNGTATIWAKDLDRGSFDNCSDVDIMFKDENGDYTPALAFDCSDLENGVSKTFILELYAIDQAGNADFCNVTLQVDDNSDVCDDVNTGAVATVTGSLYTPQGDMIEGASISSGAGVFMNTEADGAYAFSNMPMYRDYEIRASKNDDYASGLSSIDLVLIQQHILGSRSFTNVYQVIAADVNNDERVSSIDLIALRRIILGFSDSFNNNDSWRFIDADQTFENFLKPWPLDETVSISNLSADMADENMIGIKVGDVNGSVVANSLLADGRALQLLTLKVADIAYEVGDRVSLVIEKPEDVDLSAFQFTMELEGLQLEGVSSESLELTEDSYGMHNSSMLTFAWYDAVASSGSDLLTIDMIATKSGRVSETVQLTSEITKALAYDQNDLEYALSLGYEDAAADVQEAAYLLQNEPNPFKSQTTIGFYLPEQGVAEISIYDVSGRMIHNIEQVFDKGIQEAVVSNDQLGASGVLYYSLKFKDVLLQRKMILID